MVAQHEKNKLPIQSNSAYRKKEKTALVEELSIYFLPRGALWSNMTAVKNGITECATGDISNVKITRSYVIPAE